MKKSILAIFSFLGLFSAQAQLEWAPIGAKYYYNWWAAGTSELYSGVAEVTVVGDTIVQGRSCRVFQQASGAYVSWNTGCAGDHITYEEAGKVYFYREADEEFNLLYDFTKAAGEHWDVLLCEESQCTRDTLRIRVDSISFVEINGIQIRRQHVGFQRLGVLATPYYPAMDIIYEGIGSSRRMFLLRISCPTVDVDMMGLNCFESPALGIFNFIGGQPCAVFTSTALPAKTQGNLLLYPNPSPGMLSIRLPEPASGRPLLLHLFDAQGRLILLRRYEAPGMEISIPADNLPPGVYTVMVRMEEGKRYRERWVKSLN